MEINSGLAARNYADALKAAQPAVQQPHPAIGTEAGKLAGSFADILRQSEQTAKDGLVGKADPHSVVEALAASELAVETAVTIRDKVVEAYQEILRMPV